MQFLNRAHLKSPVDSFKRKISVYIIFCTSVCSVKFNWFWNFLKATKRRVLPALLLSNTFCQRELRISERWRKKTMVYLSSDTITLARGSFNRHWIFKIKGFLSCRMVRRAHLLTQLQNIRFCGTVNCGWRMSSWKDRTARLEQFPLRNSHQRWYCHRQIQHRNRNLHLSKCLCPHNSNQLPCSHKAVPMWLPDSSSGPRMRRRYSSGKADADVHMWWRKLTLILRKYRRCRMLAHLYLDRSEHAPAARRCMNPVEQMPKRMRG